MSAAVRGLVVVGVWMLASGGSVARAGMLFGFDVAVAGNHQFSAGQIHGRTLVVGSAGGNGGTVGGGLGRNPDHDTYTVVGDLNTGLNVQQGSVRVGGSVLRRASFNGGGTTKSLAGFDALDLTEPGGLQAALKTASDYFAGLTPSSQYVRSGNVLTFNAMPGADGVAVFDVNLAHLSDQNLGYILNLNGASSVVFNVNDKGTLTQLGNFQTGFLNNGSRLLWNFNSTRSDLTVDRQWFGSILMPHASLTNTSAIHGGVYVGGNFNQRGDVNQVGYSGPPMVYPTAPPVFDESPVVDDIPGAGDVPGSGAAPEVAAVPEPASILVFSLGGLIFAGNHWRKRRQPSS